MTSDNTRTNSLLSPQGKDHPLHALGPTSTVHISEGENGCRVIGGNRGGGSMVAAGCVVQTTNQGYQGRMECVFGLLGCTRFDERTRTKLICFLTEMLLESSSPIRGAAAGDAGPTLTCDFFFFLPDFCNSSR